MAKVQAWTHAYCMATFLLCTSTLILVHLQPKTGFATQMSSCPGRSSEDVFRFEPIAIQIAQQAHRRHAETCRDMRFLHGGYLMHQKRVAVNSTTNACRTCRMSINESTVFDKRYRSPLEDSGATNLGDELQVQTSKHVVSISVLGTWDVRQLWRIQWIAG